jgi:hypothetical protein
MKSDNRSQNLMALCLLCAPFLGGADGGCSGGQVAIGGDPAAGGSGGSAQSGGASGSGKGGSANAGSANAGNSSGSGGTAGSGTTACSTEEEALRRFIAENKSCSSVDDCQTQYVGCNVTEDDCTGAVYVNRDADQSVFEAGRRAYMECTGTNWGCPVCERLSPPPACINGSCVRAGSPDVCSMPFETGPCDAAIPVWAFLDGGCVQRIYGGCEGNGNRFNSLEECLGMCGDITSCPPNRIVREICVECGPSGGCARTLETCTLACQTSDECSPGFNCYDGVCQDGPCI